MELCFPNFLSLFVIYKAWFLNVIKMLINNLFSLPYIFKWYQLSVWGFAFFLWLQNGLARLDWNRLMNVKFKYELRPYFYSDFSSFSPFLVSPYKRSFQNDTSWIWIEIKFVIWKYISCPNWEQYIIWLEYFSEFRDDFSLLTSVLFLHDDVSVNFLHLRESFELALRRSRS